MMSQPNNVQRLDIKMIVLVTGAVQHSKRISTNIKYVGISLLCSTTVLFEHTTRKTLFAWMRHFTIDLNKNSSQNDSLV